MIKSIEEYVKAGKKFNKNDFSVLEHITIISTTEGFIIVNNVKIPIRNGSLDLTQWDKAEKPKKTTDKTAKDRMKRYRDRKKNKMLNTLPDVKMGEFLTYLETINGKIIIHRKNQTSFNQKWIKKSIKRNTVIHTLKIDGKYCLIEVEKQNKRIITAKRLNDNINTNLFYCFDFMFNFKDYEAYKQIYTTSKPENTTKADNYIINSYCSEMGIKKPSKPEITLKIHEYTQTELLTVYALKDTQNKTYIEKLNTHRRHTPKETIDNSTVDDINL